MTPHFYLIKILQKKMISSKGRLKIRRLIQPLYREIRRWVWKDLLNKGSFIGSFTDPKRVRIIEDRGLFWPPKWYEGVGVTSGQWTIYYKAEF